MSGLVGYGSSDEDDDVPVERPAKVAKTTHPEPELTVQPKPLRPNDEIEQTPITQPPQHLQPDIAAPAPGAELPQGPAPEPTTKASSTSTPASAPLSPYTSERQRLRELTMPTVPNFQIPDSPPPPPMNSEEAASMAATTKKFERFLELKKTGVHFNQRLQDTSSLRNPSLLPKLMEFAGISKEDSYTSTLEGDLAVPAVWPESCWPEELVKINGRREKKRMGEREKVEFVSASSSRTGTPKSGGEGRKSKFDQK